MIAWLIRIVVAAGLTLLVPAVWWLGGYDFDTRGEGAVTCFMTSVWFFGSVLWRLSELDAL